MSQATPVEGWSELLLALPEFILTHAFVDEHDELVAHVELPREVQPCSRCVVIERHPLHDRRSHTVRHLPVAGRATRVVWRTVGKTRFDAPGSPETPGRPARFRLIIPGSVTPIL
ncbi:MAG: hypothetical protein WD942_03165 [Dehalococcoidia bacterium]